MLRVSKDLDSAPFSLQNRLLLLKRMRGGNVIEHYESLTKLFADNVFLPLTMYSSPVLQIVVIARLCSTLVTKIKWWHSLSSSLWVVLLLMAHCNNNNNNFLWEYLYWNLFSTPQKIPLLSHNLLFKYDSINNIATIVSLLYYRFLKYRWIRSMSVVKTLQISKT